MEITPSKGTPARGMVANIADQIMKLGTGVCGLNETAANKLRSIIVGANPAVTVHSPRLFIASVNLEAEKLEALFDPEASGYLERVNGSERYRIEPEGEEQQWFLVCAPRFGQATIEGASKFFSYSLVNPCTKGENSRPLVLGLNMAHDGTHFKLEYARGLYRTPATKTSPAVNHLHIENLPDECLLTAVAVAAGFPYQGSRKNRPSDAERREESRLTRQVTYGTSAASEVPSGADELLAAASASAKELVGTGGTIVDPWRTGG